MLLYHSFYPSQFELSYEFPFPVVNFPVLCYGPKKWKLSWLASFFLIWMHCNLVLHISYSSLIILCLGSFFCINHLFIFHFCYIVTVILIYMRINVHRSVVVYCYMYCFLRSRFSYDFWVIVGSFLKACLFWKMIAGLQIRVSRDVVGFRRVLGRKYRDRCTSQTRKGLSSKRPSIRSRRPRVLMF